jgi:hypothetical protein
VLRQGKRQSTKFYSSTAQLTLSGLRRTFVGENSMILVLGEQMLRVRNNRAWSVNLVGRGVNALLCDHHARLELH